MGFSDILERVDEHHLETLLPTTHLKKRRWFGLSNSVHHILRGLGWCVAFESYIEGNCSFMVLSHISTSPAATCYELMSGSNSSWTNLLPSPNPFTSLVGSSQRYLGRFGPCGMSLLLCSSRLVWWRRFLACRQEICCQIPIHADGLCFTGLVQVGQVGTLADAMQQYHQQLLFDKSHLTLTPR